jgi:hypothetical protein
VSNVNGDGKSNGVFMGSENFGIYDTSIERIRKAGNASFQADFGSGFTLTSDYFYAQQDQWDRNVGLQFNSTNWQGATYVPLQSRNTGATASESIQHGAGRSELVRFADLHHPGL